MNSMRKKKKEEGRKKWVCAAYNRVRCASKLTPIPLSCPPDREKKKKKKEEKRTKEEAKAAVDKPTTDLVTAISYLYE